MPICIECSYPVPQLYHVLQSRSQRPAVPPRPTAGTRSSTNPSSQSDGTSNKSLPPPAAQKTKVANTGASVGASDVRLMQCPRCRRFADKYVEHDYVVLFIDLVLVKPQVYRHLLFNRLHRSDDRIDPSISRLGTLLLLFDVYITWSHIESLPTELTSRSKIQDLPILFQYCFFLFLCLATTAVQHLLIRWLVRISGLGNNTLAGDRTGQNHGNSNVSGGGGGSSAQHASPRSSPGKRSSTADIIATNSNASSSSPNIESTAKPSPNPQSTNNTTTITTPTTSPQSSSSRPSPNAISTALFVSSCMSLFPLLMVVWRFDGDDSINQNQNQHHQTHNDTIPPSTSVANLTSPVTSPSSNSFLTALSLTGNVHGIDWVRQGVNWIVAIQNVEALRILLGSGYLAASGLVLAGEIGKWVLRRWILGVVGLGEV